MNKRTVFLASLMLLAAANSMAMSLGRHSGAVLIGRPLDLAVQAVFDAQQDLSSLCVDADVFYADSRVDKARVRVTAEKAVLGGQDAVIRIRAASLVDEPVVSIYLRVGCQTKTERRYVVLADLVSEGSQDRGPASAAAFAALASPQSAADAVYGVGRPVGPNPKAAVTPAAKFDSNASKNPAKKPKVPAGVESGESPALTTALNLEGQARAQKSAGPKPDRQAGVTSGEPRALSRPRLTLEPLDLTMDRAPQLKLSSQLLSAPAASPQERSTAAALWRAISTEPQEVLKAADKREALEGAVRDLQAQSQKSQQSINELTGKVRDAESKQYANVLVYALLVSLLVALAGLAYLLRERFMQGQVAVGDAPWWRKRDGQKAWSKNGSKIDKYAESSGFSGVALVKTGVTNQLTPSPQNHQDVDLDFVRAGLDAFEKPSQLDADLPNPAASKLNLDFPSHMTGSPRTVKAEELFDVQQQADFFVSIGQPAQAIEVLRAHIGESVQTSAVIYLDLFNLYHQLLRKAEYGALREEFNSRFNAKVPVFDMYTDAGPGLESYQVAMSRIEALWPTPKVLEVIEESIFRRPETNAEAFNLVAYRELLLLYAVAKEIISPEPKSESAGKTFDLPKTAADEAQSRPMDFLSTSIEPLSASIDKGSAPDPSITTQPVAVSSVPPASLNIGLDFDLSKPDPANKTRVTAGTVDLPNIDFFVELAKDAGTTPVLSAVLAETKETPSADGNLIDFDAFDTSAGAGGKLK